jgi:hypothetical protein
MEKGRWGANDDSTPEERGRRWAAVRCDTASGAEGERSMREDWDKNGRRRQAGGGGGSAQMCRRAVLCKIATKSEPVKVPNRGTNLVDLFSALPRVRPPRSHSARGLAPPPSSRFAPPLCLPSDRSSPPSHRPPHHSPPNPNKNPRPRLRPRAQAERRCVSSHRSPLLSDGPIDPIDQNSPSASLRRPHIKTDTSHVQDRDPRQLGSRCIARTTTPSSTPNHTRVQ